MDWLNQWIEEQTSTPAGSILMFVMIMLIRVGVDSWLRERERKRTAKRKKPAAG